jgi:hypothetical protein
MDRRYRNVRRSELRKVFEYFGIVAGLRRHGMTSLVV